MFVSLLVDTPGRGASRSLVGIVCRATFVVRVPWWLTMRSKPHRSGRTFHGASHGAVLHRRLEVADHAQPAPGGVQL
jgi:hypothetical protein